jgi:hypothetical protein
MLYNLKKAKNPPRIFTVGASPSGSVTPESLPKLPNIVRQFPPKLSMIPSAAPAIEFQKIEIPQGIKEAETAAPVPELSTKQKNLYIPPEILAEFNSLYIALNSRPTAINPKELLVTQFHHGAPTGIHHVELVIRINKKDLESYSNFRVVKHKAHSFLLIVLTKDALTTDDLTANHHLIKFNPQDLENDSISIELSEDNPKCYVKGFDIPDMPQKSKVPSESIILVDNKKQAIPSTLSRLLAAKKSAASKIAAPKAGAANSLSLSARMLRSGAIPLPAAGPKFKVE